MLSRLRVQTSGESHGRGMLATITGLPAGLALDAAAADATLARRQGGFGRSSRQQLERDRIDVLAGLYRGRTSGAPLTLAVWNRDDSLASKPPVHRPRPGHGDLAGGQKYGTNDMRGVLERASARETAARVAAGAVASQCLRALGIELLAHVVALGGVGAGASPAAPLASGKLAGSARERRLLAALRQRRDRSPFYSLSPAADARMRRAVLAARRAGDTLGGCFEVLALGVPPGLGSLQGWDSRLDSRLGAGLLSIPAIKAVEIGDGLEAAGSRGSAVHDAVGRPGPAGPTRRGNRAGGLEAGMSNGQPLVVRAFMKPLPTLARSLPSWDYAEGAPARGFFERSDVTSVPAASVVGEAMVALVVLDALLEKTGGDSLEEVRRALAGQRRAVAQQFGRSARRRSRRSGSAGRGAGRRAARGKRG